MFRSFDPDDPLTANGLNQLTQYATKTVSHDNNGNVSGFGIDSYTYSNENLLTIATVGGTTTDLSYDPLLRLYETSSGVTASRYAYDGLNALAEYDGSGTLQRRWVFDPTTAQPVIWYEGGGLAAKRYLGADERSSIISVSDTNGASLAINTYDEYGFPAAGNLGRYGYTGQAWLGAAKLWHLNARMYSPMIDGRFMQPDPIGYGGGMNLYAYVGGDPVNYVDPLGLMHQETRCYDTGERGSGGQVVVPLRCITVWVLDEWDFADRGPHVTDPLDRKLGIGPARRARLPKPKKPTPSPQNWCGSDEVDVPEGNWGAACKRHDICYGTPGSNKESCDAQLIKDIYFECIARSPRGSAPACALIGFTYGVGLMIGGFEFRLCGAGGCAPTWFVGPSRRAFNRSQGRDQR